MDLGKWEAPEKKTVKRWQAFYRQAVKTIPATFIIWFVLIMQFFIFFVLFFSFDKDILFDPKFHFYFLHESGFKNFLRLQMFEFLFDFKVSFKKENFHLSFVDQRLC